MKKLLKYIFELWKKFLSADMVKVFSFTSISTLIRMLTSFISIKVVSILIGPSGIALLGQLNSFSTIVMSLATGGINSGVTKYVAEEKDDDQKIREYISTAFKITLICSFIVGFFMIVCNHYLSTIIMKSADYGYVFVIFGITIVLFSINNLLSSIVNGFKKYKTFVKINIANTIAGFVFYVSLVYFWGLKGALISLVTFQSVMLFITLWMLRKEYWMSMQYFKSKINRVITGKYAHYALMAFVSMVIPPISTLIVRGYMITNISAVEAGWWEAMNRLSSMYLMVITTSLGVYYLPRLSELKENHEIRREIFKGSKIILPLLLVGFAIIYLLRMLIIRILFTPDFYPMHQLFIWRLAADFFKMASWLVAYLMVAKSMTKTFIVTEIFATGLWLGLAFLLLHFNGFVGITQASFVNSVIYTITMFIIFRKTLFSRS